MSSNDIPITPEDFPSWKCFPKDNSNNFIKLPEPGKSPVTLPWRRAGLTKPTVQIHGRRTSGASWPMQQGAMRLQENYQILHSFLILLAQFWEIKMGTTPSQKLPNMMLQSRSFRFRLSNRCSINPAPKIDALSFKSQSPRWSHSTIFIFQTFKQKHWVGVWFGCQVGSFLVSFWSSKISWKYRCVSQRCGRYFGSVLSSNLPHVCVQNYYNSNKNNAHVRFLLVRAARKTRLLFDTVLECFCFDFRS